jgi:hypothetical protein
MAIFAVYAVYLAISLALTVAVGSALSRSGRVFLAAVFGGDVAQAVNRLLVVGFYLLNLGFVALTMRTSGEIVSARQAFGVLFLKIGEELLVLGGLHLANIIFFTRFRRRLRLPPAGPAPPPASPAPVPPRRAQEPVH